MATYLDQSLAQLEIFEGSIQWMYVDTVGKVTVGVGCMLPDAATASALPFLIGGQAATAAQIGADFARLMAMPPAKPAAFYKDASSPLLPQAVIDAKLLATLQSFETQMRGFLGGYDSFPDPAKLALLDMIYNLGPTKLQRQYPMMLGAMRQRNWRVAAAQCSRVGPSPARNAWTRQQFLAALGTGATS